MPRHHHQTPPTARPPRRLPGAGSCRTLAGAAALLAAWALPALAQAPAGKLVGRVQEERLDLRPDSSGQLVGWVQGGGDDRRLELKNLAGLLPATKDQTTVCLRARNRAGMYVASGVLTAADGNTERALAVDAPGFPRYTDDDVMKPHPDDLAALFLAGHCEATDALVYPAAFSSAGKVVTAMLNLGALRGDPTARLKLKGSDRALDSRCRRLGGRSTSYNVICSFQLPDAGFAGHAELVVDYAPARNPGNQVGFQVWVATPRS